MIELESGTGLKKAVRTSRKRVMRKASSVSKRFRKNEDITVFSKRVKKRLQPIVVSAARRSAQPAFSAHENLEKIAENSLRLVQASSTLSMRPSEITGRVRRRKLYGFHANDLLLLPNFQFRDGAIVQGIEAVVPALDPDLHPIEVVNWFTSPHSDLVLAGDSVSPVAWLLAGEDVEKVVALAREVGSGL